MKGAGKERVNMTHKHMLNEKASLEIMAALFMLCVDDLQLKLH